MREFNYRVIKETRWDSEILGLVAAIYKEAGKQELYLKQRPEELEKLSSALQTDGGKNISSNIAKSMEEIEQITNKIQKEIATADTAESITWTQETHRTLKQETIIEGSI